MNNAIRKTAEFKALRNKAREALVAYADGADFDFTIAGLAGGRDEPPERSCTLSN